MISYGLREVALYACFAGMNLAGRKKVMIMAMKTKKYGYCYKGSFIFWQPESRDWDDCLEEGLSLKSIPFEKLPPLMREDLLQKEFPVEEFIWYSN